jgi:CBS domain-containing protein
MKISDVMTRRVISIGPDAGIRDAMELMLKNRISGLPVIDSSGKLIGVLSETDFLRRAETGTEPRPSPWYDAFFGSGESARAYIRSHGLKVEDVMSRPPITVTGNTPLAEAVDIMERHRIKRLPVLHAGKVVGIVTRANLLRALVSIHRVAREPLRQDDAIRDQIAMAMDKETWTTGMLVEVMVHDGVVDLWGRVEDASHRDALKVLVEATPGVKRVEDHLSWTALTPF